MRPLFAEADRGFLFSCRVKMNRMTVVPSINAQTFEEAERRIKIAAEFSDRVHLDITDGVFSPAILWGSPEELPKLKINFEVHLMVREPEKAINQWLDAGVDKIAVHIESVIPDSLFKIQNLVLAINPETPAEKLLPYKDKVKQFLVLAVKPGPAGQKFNPAALEKIRFIRYNIPGAIIEVDGGINLETAKLCKDAGADILVSASYIFGDEEPKKAYEKLLNL